jgi:hypothetical protein
MGMGVTEDQIVENLPELAEAALALALGLWVEERGRDGVRRVRRLPPDFRAIVYCMDRIMGRPGERIELEVPGAGATRMEFDSRAGRIYGEAADGAVGAVREADATW